MISTTKIQQNHKWDGKIYARHGNLYKSWWIHNRQENWAYQSKNGTLEYSEGKEFDVAIYTRCENQNSIENRNLYMKYIGSQNHVKCGYHKFYLITDRNNEKLCISEGCENKVAYSCPELKCSVKICKQCFKKLPRNDQNEIFLQIHKL